MKRFLLTAFLILPLMGCEEAQNKQASLQACQFLWGTFQEKSQEAYNSEGFEKLYNSNLAQMNIEVLLSRGCCKYSETCPAAILK